MGLPWRANKMLWTYCQIVDLGFWAVNLYRLVSSHLIYEKLIYNRSHFIFTADMWPPHGATWASLRLILLSILNAKFENFLVVIGLVCSSFVCVSQGTHNRSPWFPYGLDHHDFVRIGNELTSRTFGAPGAWKSTVYCCNQKENYSNFSLAFLVPLWGCGWYTYMGWMEILVPLDPSRWKVWTPKPLWV